ncbi:HvfC/BufC family peptide modification chaperone [Rugamonas apoptosis]|uniref:Putative DNA-binding domain-containing protein n=1 Tax=Rugamonas apoptosis TaxID=2758570 RepID=A0A7W2IIW3_9BURK|nr:putative DNA-binding domain-containing protein [Rugamonas apoptosis]MBA5686115.1 putative DNA-binding domain-containing protein [Rugamonas apoptosis]
MNGLAEIQAAFQAYVLADLPDEVLENVPNDVPPDAPDDMAADVSPDAPANISGQGGAQPSIVRAVCGQSGPSGQYGLGALERLAIYRNAYRVRMREALCEAYDKTWSYLGDALFAQLADSYLAAHPSRQPNLRWYGDVFADHVAQALPEYPWVAELARFEWALGLAFDAADAAPLTAADVAQLAPSALDELALDWHPSVRLLPLRWNAVALWQALGAEQTPPDAAPSDTSVTWLVWRHGEQPHFRSLDVGEVGALSRIGEGATFGSLCEDIGAQRGEAAVPALAGYLRHWLAQGVLTPRREGCGRTVTA